MSATQQDTTSHLRPAGAAPAGGAAVPEPRPDAAASSPDHRGAVGALRDELTSEIESMARHLSSGGGTLDALTVRVLGEIEAGRNPSFEDLAAAHAVLAEAVAPATPRAIKALELGFRRRGWSAVLGPTKAIRRLSIASMFFAAMFFGLSLTPQINHETLALSIYDQAGTPLLIKLMFLLAAAGLGASFGALFEVWQAIAEGRFDPITESAHWMRIGLGVIAGLILTEIVSTDPNIGGEGTGLGITEPLLALLGGFSAGLLHLIVTRVVTAIEQTFDPSLRRGQSGAKRLTGTTVSRGAPAPEPSAPESKTP